MEQSRVNSFYQVGFSSEKPFLINILYNFCLFLFQWILGIISLLLPNCSFFRFLYQSHRDSIKSFSPPSSLFIAHVHTQKGNKIPSAAGPWSQVASTRVQSMHVTRQHSSSIQLCWPMRQLSRWIASESTLSSMDVFLWVKAPVPRLLLDEGKKLCDPKFIFIVQALSLGGPRQDFCNQFILQKLDNKNCHCAHGNNAQWGGGGRLNEWQAAGPLLFSCSWYIFNRNGAMVAPLLTCQDTQSRVSTQSCFE